MTIKPRSCRGHCGGTEAGLPILATRVNQTVGGYISNGARLSVFRFQVGRLWHRTLCRRSQTHHLPWECLARELDDETISSIPWELTLDEVIEAAPRLLEGRIKGVSWSGLGKVDGTSIAAILALM